MNHFGTNRTTRTLLTAGLLLAGNAASADFELALIGEVDAPSGGAEIVAYDPFTNKVFSTSGAGIDVFDFGVGSDISFDSFIDLSGLFGGDIDSVSSVAVDPLGRGFGAALAIPDNNTATPGELVLFNTGTGAVINRITAGFNPDMVTFTPDGGKILIANEGEASTDGDADPDGGMGIFDVTGKTLAELPGLTIADMRNFNFAPALLDKPGDLAGLRIDPRNASNIGIDLEPEYISVSGNKAYVSLQENSAIGVFDLGTETWSNIFNINGKVQTIDGSDRDGGINIDDDVFGLFMPDAIATYEACGVTYFVTANEGDARDGVPGEEARVKDLDLSDFDPTLIAELNAIYGNFQSDEALGRLQITTIDGDTDGDGDIDRLTMYGTRSFSIFNGETGALVFDSGNDFETITAAALPLAFNSDDSNEDNFESRSDAKGPEPEGVVVTEIDGTILAAIGLERIGGVMLYDVTDPNNPDFLQYINTAVFTDVEDALGTKAAPEGLAFLEQGGETFLVVSYEATGQVDVFQVVPEPSSLALLAIGGALLARRRRG
ncbi:MAG: choice-of-anchor I family protein [Planctomycetota bacterium]